MTTRYIATTGNDSTGAGTFLNPWLTISKAVSSSSSGDTVVAAAGSYTWVAQVFSFPITIQGAVAYPLTTIFDGASATFGWEAAANVTINNIQFQNATGGAVNASFMLSSSGATYAFSNCAFINLKQNNSSNGAMFYVNGLSTGTFSFLACLFLNLVGVGGVATFYMQGTTLSLTLTNCTYYTNIAAGSTLSILTTQTGVTNFGITNCIFWNANGTPVAWPNPFSGSAAYTGSNNDILGFTSAPSLANQLSTDPLFVDPGATNFNLRPTSPCIDTGTPI